MATSRMIYGAAEWERFHIGNIARKIARLDLPREIARAKRSRDEAEYLRLTAQDKRVRDAIIRLGAI